jgi:hypothetical protein
MGGTIPGVDPGDHVGIEGIALFGPVDGDPERGSALVVQNR